MFNDLQIPIIPIVDGDYLPRSEAAVLGAKNLLPITYYDGTSKVSGDTTFTVNSDGSITIVVASELASAAFFYLNDYSVASYIKEAPFLISRGNEPNSNIQMIYSDRLSSESDWNNNIICSDGSSVKVVPRDNVVKQIFRIKVGIGTPAGTYTVYPMLRLGTDTDPTYAPPALTNRELSKKFRIYSFPVSNLSLSTAWGSLYTGSTGVTIPESLDGKKFFVDFDTTGSSAILTARKISSTSLSVAFSRPDTATISGTIVVMVCD